MHYAIDHCGVKTPETCDVQYKQTYKSENQKKIKYVALHMLFLEHFNRFSSLSKVPHMHLNELLKYFFFNKNCVQLCTSFEIAEGEN